MYKMKKYRFGDPNKVSFFAKYSQFFYFFAAWNLLGLVAWKAMNANKQATHEEWKEQSGTERYLGLIGFGDRGKGTNVTHIKIDGLRVDTAEGGKEK